MLVSWEWLSEYVDIDIDHEEMAARWALTGLNHESTELVEGTPVIDLEVTSNRGDCLGHIGIAREASVLLEKELRIPQPNPTTTSEPVSKSLAIENQFTEACPRYIGRLIRGVKIGPSPEWLQKRLRAIGCKSINNVVDATNYVMYECGQPLHAFDFAQIRGGRIVIRPAAKQENFLAIDHRNYALDPSMVVIADAERAVALGGVMGGVDSEVSDKTVDVLVEAAEFAPLPIRRTARKLKLHSPSSYRYERRVDQANLDWASRRCCELILQIAGGQLLSGSVDTGAMLKPLAKPPILLRQAKMSSVLGIDVPWEHALDILKRLGCGIEESSESQAIIISPTYRADLVREIDLVEEVARVYGYEQIPEDAPVPLVASSKRPKDIMMETVRSVACAAGFSEALTPSLIAKSPVSFLSPWTDRDPMTTFTPLLEGANQLRRSIVPSLIAAKWYNQAQSNRDVALFETANVYLSQESGLPHQQHNLAVIGPDELRVVTGTFEEILHRVCGPDWMLRNVVKLAADWNYLAPNSGIVWQVNGRILGWAGNLHRSVVDSMKLDGSATVGELNLDMLLEHARLVPQLQAVIRFPTIERDLNFIVDEATQWQRLQEVIRQAGGPLCAEVVFQEIYRDVKKDGEGKKRVLLRLLLRSATETLTSDQADEVVQRIVKACSENFQASLLASQ